MAVLSLALALACTHGKPEGEDADADTDADADSDTDTDDLPLITQGSVPADGEKALDCPKAARYAPGSWGTLSDGERSFVVPYLPEAGPICTQTYDPCVLGGPVPDYASKLETVVVDAGAPLWTGQIFGDNAFQLWVNGTFLCRDEILFTPFDAHAVSFQASYPLTLAFMFGDWEQVNGVGVEYETKVGDGGAIARFESEGGEEILTGAEWRCETFYVAPLDVVSCLSGRDTSGCTETPTCPSDAAYDDCSAAVWSVPSDWMSPDFDDEAWPAATLYAAEDVTSDVAYTYDPSRFGEADFIWSKNLVVDNTVLCRITVPGP